MRRFLIMKKAMFWLSIAAAAVLVIDVLIMGIKLMGGDDELVTEGYVALISLAVWVIGMVGRTVPNKCPYCGRMLAMKGAYCPHCGKRIEEIRN